MQASALVEDAWASLPSGEHEGDIRVLAVGKAARGMAAAALQLTGVRPEHVLAIVPGPGPVAEPFSVCVAGHPLPTPGSVAAAQRALAMAHGLQANDRLVVLLSGGASALMALPADGITLADKVAVTRGLLERGADIHQINAVRKHLSAIKGGRLGVAGTARILTLALSDVIGDDLSVIGSGPTVADATTFDDALRVLHAIDARVGAWPEAVMRHLNRGLLGEVEETPKPGDPRLARHEARVIGGRAEAMAGAAREAAARGYHAIVIDEPVLGEARDASARLLDRAVELTRTAPAHASLCVISSGETTVHVTGDGRGGRNQELVLAAVERLAARDPGVVLASVGTDGVDGPTTAAGAAADATSLERARAAGLLAPGDYLGRNDAYHFFEAIGDLIDTGPTGTNVGDVQVILVPRATPVNAAGAGV